MDGPRNEELDSALDEGAELVQAAEPDEGRLLLEIGGGFWSQQPETIYRAASQIVFTMGNLEEGGAITLIDGLGAGRVEDPDGRVLAQPLTREDFPPPLVQVAQPVAGATVLRSIQIDVSLAREGSVTAMLNVDGRVVATTTLRGGRGRLVANDAPAGPAVIELKIEPRVSVEVPVTLAPRS
ncbi:MAG: hypothetical protein M3174_08450 [Actinomycetota bacterium]|nr:hypothetical protein [Actinomycetota bacterium]